MHLRLGLIAYKNLISIQTAACVFAGLIAEFNKNGWSYSVKSINSPDVDHAHNLAVLEAVKDNADWLMIMGRDNYAFPEKLMDMIKSGVELNCAIIGAPCLHRNGESLNVSVDGKAIKSINVKEVFEVDKIGSGIMAINLSWLRENWPRKLGPWFGSIYHPNGIRESQDYVFCKDVKVMGGNVFCDSRVEAGHDINLDLS